MSTIVLVGLMGCGKSTVGRIVADRLGRELVDSDSTIQARTGKTVRELWETGGEAAYRRFESQVVLDAVAATEPVVVAAPGGVVLDPAVREALAPTYVIWLRADSATVAARVKIADHRPLLGDDPERVLSEMAARRAALYQGIADVVLDVGEVDAESLADAALELYAAASAASVTDID